MRKTVLVALACALSLLSCDRRAKLHALESQAEKSMMMSPAPMKDQAKMIKVNETEIVERKLIKNGQITFSTRDINETRKELEKACKEFNGYVSSEEQQKLNGTINYQQIIRIPASQFDRFMKVIEALGEHIEYRNLTTQDVTEEFIDIEARLKTKKELELRYHQLLGKATKVEDMLSIEEQISIVRTEIETMQGRLQYIINRVGYSTLTVNYHQLVPNSDPGFGSRLASSFVSGWHGLLVFLIGITTAWPFILIMSCGVWFLTRWVKKNRQTSTEIQ